MVGLAAPAASAAPDKDKSGKAVGNDNANQGKGNNNAGGNSGGNNAGGNSGGNNAGGNSGGNNAGGNSGGSNSGETVVVCHRKASDKNPYTIIRVSESSAGLPAHEAHLVENDEGPRGEDKYWGIDGTWNGVVISDGTFKPDFILGHEGNPAGWANIPTDEAAFVAWCLAEPQTEDQTEDVLVALPTLDLTMNGKCGEYGKVTDPSVAGDLVEYSLSNGEFGENISGSVTVTAVLDDEATAFRTPLPEGWKPREGDDRTADYLVPFNVFTACTGGGDGGDGDGDGDGDGGNDGDNGSTTKIVSPRYASATDATCSRNGRLVVPNQPKGVRVQRTGSVPGTVTFTYSPAKGFTFPKGTNRKVTLQVEARLTGVDCIRGVETVRPNPQPANGPGNGPAAGPVNAGNDAEVLGEQAVAVPTAVAAGLGDTMTAATTTGSPQLAQALVAAGLLMLVMGGATGLGRRTRGAHES